MAQVLSGMQAVVHVRFAGRSFDVSMAALQVGPSWPDVQIKRALARSLDLTIDALDEYVIDRHANGNLTVRPPAVFG